MRQPKRKRETPNSADRLIREIGSHLARDFRESLDDRDAVNVTELFLHGDAAAIRGYNWHEWSTDDPYVFKRRYQLGSLLKRYRFQKDLMSVSELKEAAEMQFFDNQLRLAGLDFDALNATINYVLFCAAGYCHTTLGNYDIEEHLALCRNGKKASVGIPMRAATEAARYEAPITGSSEHIAWYSAVHLAEDPQTRDYVFGNWDPDKGPLFRDVKELALTFVPKTFKSLRSIMPNTTIGAFYTDGLGKVLTSRLKRAGYDLTDLQDRHRELACLASVTGTLVTADQSLASDNITSWLVGRLLPPKWRDAISLGRIDWVKLPSGLRVKTPTFMTMGIGFTFPLQTLIFLSLLKAIDQVFTNGRSEISVFGDDLIYSSRMHPFVLYVFGRLGLQINNDKTFATGKFRESCGGDYFAGVDVRPFLPKNERGSRLSNREYETLLYVWTNGLLRRWAREEVPLTFDYLLSEISRVSRGVLRVPPDFPDGSGIKVESPRDTLNQTCRLVPVKYCAHGVIRFTYLREIPYQREETSHAPYLWRHLGSGGGDDFHYLPRLDPRVLRSSKLLQTIERVTGASNDRPTVFTTESRRSGHSRGSLHPGVGTKQRRTFIPEPGGGGRVLSQVSTTVRWG